MTNKEKGWLLDWLKATDPSRNDRSNMEIILMLNPVISSMGPCRYSCTTDLYVPWYLRIYRYFRSIPTETICSYNALIPTIEKYYTS